MGLKEIIDKFSTQSVLVVGDIILDQYVWCSVSRISPEAPVPVALVEKETYRLGGAANVAHNITTLGGTAYLVGVVGEEGKVTDLCEEVDINSEGVIHSSFRPTTVKTRIMASNQQIVRVDREKTHALTFEEYESLMAKLKEKVSEAGVVIVSDYNKGVVTESLMHELVSNSQSRIVVDTKSKRYRQYQGVELIAPSFQDALAMTGLDSDREDIVQRLGSQFRRTLNCSVLITHGAEGMHLFDGDYTHIPTKAQQVYDVTGAGDTVMAALGLSLASGASLKEAAEIATYAASVVISKVGTATCSYKELCDRIESKYTNSGSF